MIRLETIDNKTYIYDDKTGWTEKDTGAPAPDDVLKLLTTKNPNRGESSDKNSNNMEESKKKPKEELEEKPKKIGRPKKTKEDYRKDLELAKKNLEDSEKNTAKYSFEDKELYREARDLENKSLKKFNAAEERFKLTLSREEKADYIENTRKKPIEVILPEKSGLEDVKSKLPRTVRRETDPNKDLRPVIRDVFGELTLNSNYIPEDFLEGEDSYDEYLEKNHATPIKEDEGIKSSMEEVIDQLSEIDNSLKDKLTIQNDVDLIKEEYADEDATSMHRSKKSGKGFDLLAAAVTGGALAYIFDPVQKLLDGIESLVDTLSDWYNSFVAWIDDSLNFVGSKIKEYTPWVADAWEWTGDKVDGAFDFNAQASTENTNDAFSDPISSPENNAAPTKDSIMPSYDPTPSQSQKPKKSSGNSKFSNPPRGNIVALSKWLESKGLRTSGNALIGKASGKHDHGKNSSHYVNKALDINVGSGMVEADDPKWGPIFDDLAKSLHDAGYVVVWRAKGHRDHIHVQLGGRGIKGGKSSSFVRKHDHNHDDERPKIRARANKKAKDDAKKLVDDPSIDNAKDFAISGFSALISNLKGLAETDTYYKGSIEDITKKAIILDNAAIKKYSKAMMENKTKNDVLQLPNLNKKPGTIHTYKSSDDSWIVENYIEYFDVN